MKEWIYCIKTCSEWENGNIQILTFLVENCFKGLFGNE